jgi:hypothetical protein
MNRFLVLAAIAILDATASAQQVATPPEDNRPYLSIFTNAQYAGIPHEAALVKAFETDPNLIAIKSQCRWNHYQPHDQFYKQRFAKLIPPDRLPAVLLQRSDGGYVYKATGSNVPDSGAEIFDEMSHYAGLDPLRGPADSREARPFDKWRLRITGDGGVPDIDGPPRCPDGKCPLPDALPDYPSGPVQIPADSAELLGGGDRMPIRNMAAAAVFVVGIMAAAMLGLFGLMFLVVVVYLLAKAVR